MSKEYEEMSDFEINKRVAIALRPFLSNYKFSVGSEDGEACFTSEGDNRAFNYLKWVNYAWPIIVENNISLELDDGCLVEAYILETYASNSKSDRISVVDENPLRAAMICFLKMKDAESDHP